MAKPTQVTVTIQDNDNEFATMGFFLSSATNTIAGIETAAQNMVEKIQACITGNVTQCVISYPLDISGWTLVPSPDGDDTDKLVGARVIYRNADNFKAQINLPTFDLTKVSTPGKDVNLADPDILALNVAVVANNITTNQNQVVSTVHRFYETYGGKG